MLLASEARFWNPYHRIAHHPFHKKIYGNYISGTTTILFSKSAAFAFLFFIATRHGMSRLRSVSLLSLWLLFFSRRRALYSRSNNNFARIRAAKSPNCDRFGSNRLRVNYRLHDASSPYPGGRCTNVSAHTCARACVCVCVCRPHSVDSVRTSPAIRRVVGAPHAPPHAASALCVSAAARCLARPPADGNFGLCHGNFSLDQNNTTTMITTTTTMTIHSTKFLGTANPISSAPPDFWKGR